MTINFGQRDSAFGRHNFGRDDVFESTVACKQILNFECYNITQMGFLSFEATIQLHLYPANSWFFLRFPRETTASNLLIFHRACEKYVTHVFDITSDFTGNPYKAGSPKRSSYVAERTRKRQNKFTNSFYWLKSNIFVLWAGRRLSQRN